MTAKIHGHLREIAITFDQLRVIPRIVMLTYMYLSYDMILWVKTLAEPSTQHTAMFTVLIGGIVGMFTAYASTGPKSFKSS